MASLYDYHRVAANCSRFGKEEGYVPMEPDPEESCMICRHFNADRRHCRLDLYDKLHSGLAMYRPFSDSF